MPNINPSTDYGGSTMPENFIAAEVTATAEMNRTTRSINPAQQAPSQRKIGSLLAIHEQPLRVRLLNELAQHEGGIDAWNEFCKCVPSPLDLRLVTLVTQGACQCFNTAITALQEPNQKAQALVRQLELIANAIQKNYVETNEAEVAGGLFRTLTSHPEWRVLAESTDRSLGGTAFQFIVGVELSVSLAQGRPMAHSFSADVRRDRVNLTHSPSLLWEAVFDESEPLRTAWSTRFKKQLVTFQTLFEGGNPRPLPRKSLNDRLEAQWTTKAAFSSFTARAAVLDDRCLSAFQFEKVILQCHVEGNDDYKAAVFFVGICGFIPTLVAEIPLGGVNNDSSICYMDLSGTNCVLVRDLERLAYDQASPQGLDGQPASLVLTTAIPQDIGDHLRERLRATPHAKRLGELVPLLTQINSGDGLYPNLEEMEPTWAKLRPTIGRVLRLHGYDSFLTALLTADFSHTAKSKIYYATITPNEWWTFVAQAYECLGFESPLPLVGHGLAFGSRVTPSATQIRHSNQVLVANVLRARPPRKASTEALLQFHAEYTYLVAFRVQVLLALREAASIPMPGPGDVSVQYLIEKSSAGRRGGMAALIPKHLEQQVVLYRSHCKTLLSRVQDHTSSDFTEWLNRIARGESEQSFCTCSVRKLATPVSTGQVLAKLACHTRFAPDIGRKYLENELRLRNVRTTDIDRILRHDVAGQSATTGTSDASEVEWVRRMRPTLDCIAEDLGFELVHGLDGSSK